MAQAPPSNAVTAAIVNQTATATHSMVHAHQPTTFHAMAITLPAPDDQKQMGPTPAGADPDTVAVGATPRTLTRLVVRPSS